MLLSSIGINVIIMFLDVCDPRNVTSLIIVLSIISAKRPAIKVAKHAGKKTLLNKIVPSNIL